MVTISTDNITETNEYRTGVGAHWPFLSDAGRMVQKDLDIAEYTDPLPQSDDSPCDCARARPGHLQGLQRLLVSRPADLEDLRQDLSAVTKKCRPDWDITTPELKAAWQQGRKELFYPYGKTYAQTLGEQD